MSIKTVCTCGRASWLGDHQAGQRVACKVCGKSMRVTALSSPAVPASNAAASDEDDLVAPEFWQPAGAGAASHPRARRPLPHRASFRAPFTAPSIADRHASRGKGNRLRLSLLQFYRCRPQLLLIPVLPLTFGIAWGLLCSALWPVLLGALVTLTWLFSQTGKVRSCLACGSTDPALVISANPWRVAVLTNLAADRAGVSRSAVKVLPAPLKGMALGPSHLGQQLAAASTFSAGVDPAVYGDVHPLILHTVIADRATLSSALDSVPPADWQSLFDWVDQHPQPAVGLYRQWPGSSSTLAPWSMPRPRRRWSSSHTALAACHGLVALLGAIGTLLRTPKAPEPTNAPAIVRQIPPQPLSPAPLAPGVGPELLSTGGIPMAGHHAPLVNPSVDQMIKAQNDRIEQIQRNLREQPLHGPQSPRPSLPFPSQR